MSGEYQETIFEKSLHMIYICNIKNDDLEKYKKAILESRAIGVVLGIAFDMNGKETGNESGLYFKDRVEYNKFLKVLNCINYNEPYEYHDLKEISTQELLDEISYRINGEWVER